MDQIASASAKFVTVKSTVLMGPMSRIAMVHLGRANVQAGMMCVYRMGNFVMAIRTTAVAQMNIIVDRVQVMP